MRATNYVLDLREIDQTQIALVGGKGASLGELSRIDGIHVPDGFCVTTNAFRRGAIPDDVAAAIASALAKHGEHAAYAVRSSATAEDSPTMSFAGQYDTYLNISGLPAILVHVSKCWASLFTERAVTYRMQNGIDERTVSMAVVIQRMVDARASGVLFTADPITGHRKVSSVEAVAGLSDALVSGLVNADIYKVRDSEIIDKTERQAVLTDAQVLRLVQIGRKIEAHFGRPQDIEWCLADDDFQIVQSRPITTLFPIPFAGDSENHVYLSTGHQQMMTDAMKPLGISMRQLTAGRPFHEAGGRLFVDVTRELASPSGRAALFAMAGKNDPLIADALQTIIDRHFIPPQPDAKLPARGATAPLETDPAIVAELIARGQESNAILAREIQTKSGPALFDFILADLQELKRMLFDPQSHQAIMAGIEATWWLNEHLEKWLGEKNAADTLAQSAPNNVTSQMGLDLLHVADVIRPHADVVEFLQRVDNDDFLNELPQESRDAIQSWLDKYGMRCVGEIDITRPRWSERPSTLVPLILGNIKNFAPGAGELRFEQGLQAARNKEEDLLERLRTLPDGAEKAEEVKRMIDRLRTFVGYREYPKYFNVNRYFSYKQALLREAERLELHDKEDIFFLTFQELHEAVRTHEVDHQLIRDRKDAFRQYERLTPPRVLTSDGEVIAGSYRRDDLPAGTLAGLAVSAGTVEGRARVIFDPAQADLEPGDILVTTFTDPSWTPAFVAIRGLVTEVGGLMTHGAVIAREYGLPAVVGVENATRLIRDGQRIRVHGTNGSVELLA